MYKNNNWKHKALNRVAAMLLLGFVVSLFLATGVSSTRADSWKTDKWDKKRAIEAGGWKVVYFEEIDSMDAVEAGIASYIGGPAGFELWFDTWITKAMVEFGKDASDTLDETAEEAAMDFVESMLDDLMAGKIPSVDMKTFGAIEIKGGIAEYHGCNTIYNPFSQKRVCAHPEAPSWQPYVAVRVKPGATPDSGDFDTGWRICNKSSDPKAWVAYSYMEGSKWITKGWRQIARGTCSIILNQLNNRYVYYYAEGTDGNWSGSTNLCIHPTKKFSLGENVNCSSPYELAKFHEVDTGEYDGWTTNLVD